MKSADLARRVARGYVRFLRSVGEAVLLLIGMIGIAFGVSYPVWWLAVNRRGLYTVLVAGGCLAALAVLVIRRTRAARRAGPGARGGGPRAVRILARLLLAAGAYGTGVLFLRSPMLGTLAALVLLAVAGVWAFGRGGQADRGR